MNRAESLDLPRNGEDSAVKLRRGDVRNHDLAVRVTLGPGKPYARVRRNRRASHIRVGGTSREASREELERIYRAPGRRCHGLKPAPGAGLDALELRRLRDYGYVDARGMGVRNKLFPGMRAHNGTAPERIEEEQRFTVRLWKGPKPA